MTKFSIILIGEAEAQSAEEALNLLLADPVQSPGFTVSVTQRGRTLTERLTKASYDRWANDRIKQDLLDSVEQGHAAGPGTLDELRKPYMLPVRLLDAGNRVVRVEFDPEQS